MRCVSSASQEIVAFRTGCGVAKSRPRPPTEVPFSLRSAGRHALKSRVVFFAGEKRDGGEWSHRIGNESDILGDVKDVSLRCGAVRCRRKEKR